MSRTYRQTNWLRTKTDFHIRTKRIYSSFSFKMSEEELKAESELDFLRSRKDGYYAETGRKTAFKNKCSRHLRHQNSLFCKNAAASEDFYDETSAPRRKDTSTFIWDFF